MRQIFLDTETTGLSADNGDRLVEIGLIEMVDRRLTGDNRHWYLNPERSSHPDALRVHGLTDEFLADKPKFADIVQELLDYVADAELVIHNASFDLGFLDAELARLDHPPLASRCAGVVDSLQMARELYPGQRASLDALCKRLEVDNSSRTLHGALLDAGLLAEVYIRMTRGQDSLVIDAGDDAPGTLAVAAIDLTQFDLPVLRASDAECQAHEAVLADLDKATGDKTLWRRIEPRQDAETVA
ncbi:DNA polymerase III subunit epsilon [Rubrivivax albus]|uniref:DNA polymerase III subunit epsilon n=1 Tax=Rubrivivax albus TaxID=2499835 RepID=A0A437JSP9_9BURK|nr:DNA polymerase III subunit epsilon [Rubrivivax albus]RVT50084.1 DNA polymerase III subunit epsilon [Rubrivivax albus]